MPANFCAPLFSVVMPYFNNARTVVRALRSWTEQTVRPAEIVLVDDGSAIPAQEVLAKVGGTWGGVPLRVLQARHGGQSAATNAGIHAAVGELVMLSCPDIVAPPDTLALHLQAHAEAERGGSEVGVMGHIAYAPWLRMTPFLRYLSKPGPQFCYHLITDAENADPAHLYAPACSVPRKRLLAVGGFDEVFTYGYQDTDLGLRLAACGLRFVYRKAAHVWHDHPNDLDNFCARNERVASLTWHLLDKHPQVLQAQVLRDGLRAWGRSSGLLPRLQQEVQELEARVCAGPKDRRAAVAHLLELRYAGLLSAAFSRGLLRGGDGMRRRLQLDAAEWQDLAARLLPQDDAPASKVALQAAPVAHAAG